MGGNGQVSQPVQGAGGLTNHALGSMMSLANNPAAPSNLNNNSNMNAAAGVGQPPQATGATGLTANNAANNNN